MVNGEWGMGNTLARNGKTLFATLKKQTNPDKYDADGYDLKLILCLTAIIPNSNPPCSLNVKKMP
jgi:hypothetical protein